MFFQDLQEVAKYDAIWACSSILHLPIEELEEVMEKMKAENSLLKGLDEIIETHEITKKDIPLLEKINNILFQF